jgi:hypothetical protein
MRKQAAYLARICAQTASDQCARQATCPSLTGVTQVTQDIAVSDTRNSTEQQSNALDCFSSDSFFGVKKTRELRMGALESFSTMSATSTDDEMLPTEIEQGGE